MRILMIGATGRLGQPVARALAEAGFEVTAYVRDLAKARKVLPAGVRLVEGNLRQPAKLAAAMDGQQALYLNLSVAQDERPNDWHAEEQGLAAALEAAQAARVGRVVYLSSLIHRWEALGGTDWWVFALKRRAVATIWASGLPYTIFYPSAFMEALLMARRGKGVGVVGQSEVKLHYIAGADYGQMVARSLRLDLTGNHDYDVQGPEGMTQLEAATCFVAAYKKEKLKVDKVPLAVLKVIGLVDRKARFGYNLLKSLNEYPERFASEAAWERLGKPTTTLEQFARGL